MPLMPKPPISSSLAEFKQSILESHNRLRTVHGAPPLVWSEDCALEAKQAADVCQSIRQKVSVGKHRVMHSSDSESAQNVWMAAPPAPAAAVVEGWYNTRDGYDFGSEPKDGAAACFTQVVWADCCHVGAASSEDGVYIVANYNPPGNVTGQYKSNVFSEGTPPAGLRAHAIQLVEPAETIHVLKNSAEKPASGEATAHSPPIPIGHTEDNNGGGAKTVWKLEFQSAPRAPNSASLASTPATTKKPASPRSLASVVDNSSGGSLWDRMIDGDGSDVGAGRRPTMLRSRMELVAKYRHMRSKFDAQEAANNEVATENEQLKAENSSVAAMKSKFAEEIDWANQTLEEALSENETLLVVASKLAVTMLGAVLGKHTVQLLEQWRQRASRATHSRSTMAVCALRTLHKLDTQHDQMINLKLLSRILIKNWHYTLITQARLANAIKRAVGPNARQAISCWCQNTEEDKNGERNAMQTAVAVTVVQQAEQRKIKTSGAQRMARWLQQWKHGQLRALMIYWRSNFTREALPTARILSTKAQKFSLLCILKVLCVWDKEKRRQAEYIYRHEAFEGWKSGLKLNRNLEARLKLDRKHLSPTSETARRRRLQPSALRTASDDDIMAAFLKENPDLAIPSAKEPVASPPGDKVWNSERGEWEVKSSPESSPGISPKSRKRLQPSALRTASDDDIMAAFLKENPDLALQISAPGVEVEVETKDSADKEVLQMVRQGKSTMSPKQINETRRRRKSISDDTLRSSSPIPTMGSDLML